jgi:addiction module HigA family antidote
VSSAPTVRREPHGDWSSAFAFAEDDDESGRLRGLHVLRYASAMKSHPAKRSGNLAPSHPGELLAEVVIPATGRSKAEIARLLGISRQTLYDILNQRQPVTPAVAVRLGKLFGDGTGIWIRMQAAYDTWHAEREVDVSDIKTLEVA